MYNFLFTEKGCFKLFLNLLTVPVDHGQIEGSKVGVKIFIHQLIVNAEVMRVCGIFNFLR